MIEVLLFTVDDAFQLSGRPGLALVPGIPNLPGMPYVRIGSPIVLSTPGGKRLNTEVAAFEMLDFGSRPRPAICPYQLDCRRVSQSKRFLRALRYLWSSAAVAALAPNNSFKADGFVAA